MTELDIISGRIACAGSFAYTGEQIMTYVPQLLATTTNPYTGSDGVHEGWWVKIGNLVSCWGRIQFNGSDTSAGSGTYQISLPTIATELGPLNFTGSGPLLGWGVVRDNSAVTANSRQITPRLSDTFAIETNTGLFRMAVTDGTTLVVNDSAPFAWTNLDRISFHCIYPAELEMIGT